MTEKNKNAVAPNSQAETQNTLSALHERAEAFARFRHTVIPTGNRYRFLAVAAAIGVLGFLVFPSDSGAERVEAQAKQAALPVLDISRFDMGLESSFASNSHSKTITLKSGDNLGPLLQRNGLTSQDAYRVTQAFGDVFKPRNLRAGQDFYLHFTGEMLDHLIFKPNIETTVFIDREGETYAARKIEADFKYETISVKAEVENSLYVDATRLGAPDKVVVQFANIY